MILNEFKDIHITSTHINMHSKHSVNHRLDCKPRRPLGIVAKKIAGKTVHPVHGPGLHFNFN